jgi:aminoglycoside phosphotransferase (APT) family kinase protein
MTAADPPVAPAALSQFLDEQLGGGPVPATLESLPGGGSCEVFALERGDQRWILRRAPAHANTKRAHDVLREYRILHAIHGCEVRVPRPIVSCDEPRVFDRPFYVMERVEGVPVRGSIPAAWVAAPDTQARAVEELIDALVEVHAVDWRAVGLGDLGKAEGFLERQVERWLAQLASYQGRDLPAAHELARWLDAHRPEGQSPTLFHGDYKLDNVLFTEDAPPRALAVVDWEMGTIGDPLIDLAWALIFHPVGGTMPLGTAGPEKFDLDRIPSPDAMVERYAQRSGRDVSAIDWYHVFARWKAAIVLEGSFAKWQRGESDKPVHEWFGPQADLLLESATGLVRSAAPTSNRLAPGGASTDQGAVP